MSTQLCSHTSDQGTPQEGRAPAEHRFPTRLLNRPYRNYLVVGILMLLLLSLSGGIAATAPEAQEIPTFKIASVVEDESVTVETDNFPANRDFVVRMAPFGNRAIGGTAVETINSGEGGAFTATFPIPESLQGLNRIAIRMDSQTGGFVAYNWFWNNTAP